MNWIKERDGGRFIPSSLAEGEKAAFMWVF